MKSFRYFMTESIYQHWLNQDQKFQNPADRGKLQAKVIKHFQNPTVLHNVIDGDRNNLHAAFILHQHMDNHPAAQEHFLNALKSHPDFDDDEGLQRRAQFLTDRINVNKKIKEIYNENPDAYKDKNGNSLGDDPVKALRDDNRFNKVNFPYQSRDAALQGAKENNPLLYKAVVSAKAETQPSYAVHWGDVSE